MQRAVEMTRMRPARIILLLSQAGDSVRNPEIPGTIMARPWALKGLATLPV